MAGLHDRSSPPGTLSDELLAAGRAAGLAGVGICDLHPFPRDDIEDAVSSGRSAGMHFTFTEESSTDVRRSFPWAVSGVVGAWSYLDEAGAPGDRPGTARVARFATADHYADLRRALGSIAERLTAAGHRTEILIDDNRLVDRAAAVRAGVGWWGKNTMVLAPGAGPWLLLGTVVTDAGLEPTSPMARDCGTCDACLPACPTGALVEPGVLDARKCIAYWAQAPGAIPPEIREPMGDRLYGCDDCLEACPPGRRALEEVADRQRGRHDIVGLLSRDDAALLAEFDHFYIPKRRARFLRRNALVALGNTGGPGAAAVAAGYLGHPDPLLRAHAAWALGSLGGPMAVAALQAAAASEGDAAVAAEISEALGRA